MRKEFAVGTRRSWPPAPCYLGTWALAITSRVCSDFFFKQRVFWLASKMGRFEKKDRSRPMMLRTWYTLAHTEIAESPKTHTHTHTEIAEDLTFQNPLKKNLTFQKIAEDLIHPKPTENNINVQPASILSSRYYPNICLHWALDETKIFHVEHKNNLREIKNVSCLGRKTNQFFHIYT